MGLEKKITIEDVARDAGVSIATVSRVLNSFDGVSNEVLNKVNNSIEKLGYKKNSRGPKNSLTNKTLGVVIPNINNPYSADIVKMLQNTVQNLGYDVLIMDNENSDEKSIYQVKKLIKLGVSGIIYLPTHYENSYEKELENISTPIVNIGRRVSLKSSFVGCETFKGIYNGTKYLLSLGHKNISYITGDLDSHVDREGYEGFLKAYKESGIEFNEKNLIFGDYDMDKTEEKVSIMLKEKNITAFLCSGDVMAYGVLKAAKKLELKVPEDLSVMGFDDLPVSSVMGLTTISQNSLGIGQSVALLVNDLIEKRKESPQEILLPTNLVLRSTCGICR